MLIFFVHLYVRKNQSNSPPPRKKVQGSPGGTEEPRLLLLETQLIEQVFFKLYIIGSRHGTLNDYQLHVDGRFASQLFTTILEYWKP